MLYKFPLTPTNVIMFIPRMICVGGILVLMVGYMGKQMIKNHRETKKCWGDQDA